MNDTQVLEWLGNPAEPKRFRKPKGRTTQAQRTLQGAREDYGLLQKEEIVSAELVKPPLFSWETKCFLAAIGIVVGFFSLYTFFLVLTH